MHTKFVEIAIGVLFKDHRYCLSQRKKSQSFADKWEFPGGKVEQGESCRQALSREFEEELGVTTQNWQPLITIPWHYESVSVRLNVFLTDDFSGTAYGKESQNVSWFSLEELLKLDFPAANQGILTALQLHDQYFLDAKKNALADRITAIDTQLAKSNACYQLYLPEILSAQQSEQVQALLDKATEQGSAILLSGYLAHYEEFSGFSGIHLSFADLEANARFIAEFTNTSAGSHADSQTRQDKPSHRRWLLISVHNQQQLNKAKKYEPHILLLSPVKPTSAHPNLTAMGWTGFADLVSEVCVPVYALGGIQSSDIDEAIAHGARGVAGRLLT